MSQTRQHVPRRGRRALITGVGVLLLVGVVAVIEGRRLTDSPPLIVSPPSPQAGTGASAIPRTEPDATASDIPSPANLPATPPRSAGLGAEAKPTGDVAPAVKPSFDIVRVSPEGSAVMAGTAAPNQPVIVRESGNQIGRTTADPTGQWVLTPEKPLHPGTSVLTLVSPGANGGETSSPGVVVLELPERAGSTRTATAEPPHAPLAVLVPGQPGSDTVSRVLQAPSALPPGAGAAARLDLDVVDYDDHGAITFSGHAPPEARVRLYVDNLPAGDAVADAQSRWKAVPPESIAAGRHRVRVDQLDRSGIVVRRVELPFLRESLPAQSLAEGRVVVQPGASLWRIARQAYGSGARYTVIYDYNQDQIRNPALIYPGQTFLIPDAASAVGTGAGTPVSSSRSR